MKLFKRILTGVLAVMLLVSALPVFSASVYAYGGNKTVKAGFFAFPGYHDMENGVRSGYGYDFLTLLQRYTDLNFDYVGYENSWEDMQQMLLDGEIDLVTSARKTTEREKIFDFSEPIGTNSAQINVRVDDERFIPGDYGALDGVIIGELTGNSRNVDTAEFASGKGFKFKTRYYEDAESLQQALQDGDVDAIATSSLRKADGEKTIAEFAPESFYVIVRKGNQGLLDEINYGITQMDAYEGNWRDDLHYASYGAGNDKILSFSQRERTYIQSVQNGEKTITVSAQPDINPYSYVEGGELTGIIPDYFAHLMEMAGLPYTTLVAKDKDEVLEWMTTDSIDVIMDCSYETSPSAQYDLGMVTEPYMQLTTSRVTQKGFSGTIETIATAGSRGMDYSGEDISGNAEYMIVDSGEDAMQAVRDGRADACYVSTYLAEKFINSDPNSNLQTTILEEPVYNVCVCVSPDSDHELCSVLNKCIKADASGVLDGYVKRYTTVSYENLSIRYLLKLHPEYYMVTALILIALIALIAVAVARARIEKVRNDQLEREMEQRQEQRELSVLLVSSLSDAYSALYYVSADTGEYQMITRDNEYGNKVNTRLASGGSFYEDVAKSTSNVLVQEDWYKMNTLLSKESIEQAFGEHNSFMIDYRLAIDGAPVWYRAKVVKIPGVDSGVHYAIGIMNIEEQLQREAAAARDAAVIAGLSDDFGCVVYVNYETGDEAHYRFDPLLSASIPGWEEITNFDLRISVLADTLVHPDDQDFFRTPKESKEKILDTVQRDGVFYHNFRVVIGGDVKYYQMKIVRDENSDNHIIAGFRSVDETVRREMEYQEKLEAANKSKSDFLFNMSHDIRTPMNAIIGFTQLAKKYIDDKERTLDSLNKIEASGSHLLELINEVLDMSRVEAGKLHSEMKIVNVSDAAKRLVTICRESANERNIKLAYEEKNIQHPVVVADELHINQIIMNILGNAIKYTLPGGNVCYTVEEVCSDVPGYGKYVLTVEDTGVGMSEEFRKHVFESFSRENSEAIRGIQGTGLGMSIVKRLVDYMDGSIEIESEQGKGTKVTVILHLMLSEPGQIPSGDVDVTKVDLRGRTALLVEDNELNREIATEILEEQGVVVEEAVNGIDAVEHVKKRGAEYYDFVLMDIQMPLMDGYQATMEIRKLPGSEALPIIALSANAFEEDKQKSVAAGMNDHVAKPIMIPELLAALAKFV